MSMRSARGDGTPPGGGGGGGGGGAPSGPAGGSLGGTYPNPTVIDIAVGSDAAGDLYYRDASNVLVRLPKGIVGQALVQTGATPLPAWGNDFGARNVVTTGSGTFGSLRATGLTAGIGHLDSSGNLTSSTIVNADVDAAAAIAGSKISPAFGAQAVTTTSTISAGAIPATTGDIRLSTGSAIWFRNNANSANIAGIIKTAGDSLIIGADGSLANRPASLLIGASGAMTFYAGGLNSGVLVLSSTGASIEAGAVAAWTFTGQSSNVATKDWTFTSNAPFASATGTNRNPGNFVWKVPAAISGGAEGKHSFQVAAVETFSIQSGTVNLANHSTTASAPSAGGGGALPLTPLGYVTLQINGVARQIAYY